MADFVFIIPQTVGPEHDSGRGYEVGEIEGNEKGLEPSVRHAGDIEPVLVDPESFFYFVNKLREYIQLAFSYIIPADIGRREYADVPVFPAVSVYLLRLDVIIKAYHCGKRLAGITGRQHVKEIKVPLIPLGREYAVLDAPSFESKLMPLRVVLREQVPFFTYINYRIGAACDIRIQVRVIRVGDPVPVDHVFIVVRPVGRELEYYAPDVVTAFHESQRTVLPPVKIP